MGRKKYTTEKFTELARKLHGDKYDYSKVNYVDMITEIEIVCPKHGVFKILPYSHLSKKKHNCEKCSFKNRTKTFKEFEKQANIIHDNKYEYIESTYNGSRSKITVICPIHGKFNITAHHHLAGFGCKKCTYENRRNNKIL